MMKKNIISQRLEALREVMRREKLTAFIFPSTDAHQSEYVPDHWKGREWISGFNGSAGTAVVTLHSAALWTDSRYFLAAEEQLAGTEFQLMRLKILGTPSIPEWIAQELSDTRSPEVGLDGMTHSFAEVKELQEELRQKGGITLRTNFDPLSVIWTDRPAIPLNPIEVHPIELAGESVESKLKRIRTALVRLHADGMLVSALDDVAWSLNIRGTDVACNPVAVAYLLITSHSATLYTDLQKLTTETEKHLYCSGVNVKSYNDVEEGVRKFDDYSILIDPSETAYRLGKLPTCQKVVFASSPIPAMKAVKNKTELKGMREAMKRDGIAMVKFLRWLLPAVKAGGQTELSISEKLRSLRAEQANYRGLSFETIAGYEAHGAIVHYEPTTESDAPLNPRGLLLLDSGAQYTDGTTDITRTIALGKPTEEEKHIYTLVLKGHIQIELCKFPDGASGTQLDILAREALWREGLNFLHGTGHGVGSYLNVHEGPHQIRMEWKPAPLHAGMTVTDEPGIYIPGKFGVRIENTLVIAPYLTTDFGDFLQMESLTLCPIDTSLIQKEYLLDEEIKWLNMYHQRVFNELAPYLNNDEQEWLKSATKAI